MSTEAKTVPGLDPERVAWMRTRLRKAAISDAGTWGQAWVEAYVEDVTALLAALEVVGVVEAGS